MNKLMIPLLIGMLVVASDYGYNGSTTAPVIIAGSIIKAKNIDNVKKYKRSECPVCKGKGWYISGDGIKKVDCGYCEPEETKQPAPQTQITPNPECKTKVYRK